MAENGSEIEKNRRIKVKKVTFGTFRSTQIVKNCNDFAPGPYSEGLQYPSTLSLGSLILKAEPLSEKKEASKSAWIKPFNFPLFFINIKNLLVFSKTLGLSPTSSFKMFSHLSSCRPIKIETLKSKFQICQNQYYLSLK